MKEWEFLLGSSLKYTVISKEARNGFQYWVMEARNE